MIKNSSKLGFGAVVLLISGVVCKALGALFRLPLTNLLGIEGIGVFQLVMSLYAFALVVTCGGVTNSLAKLISSARAEDETKKINLFLLRALISSISIALALGVIFLLLSKVIASLQNITAYSSYALFIFLLPLGAILATLRGFFQGYENMLPTATSQVVEQVFKFAFGLLFAFEFGKSGTAQGVFGAFLGIVLSELVAVIQLCIWFLLKFKQNKNLEAQKILLNKKLACRQFAKANYTLMLSASILPLVNAFDGLVIVDRLTLSGITAEFATKLYGLQTGVVGALLNFPLIISVSVTTALLPNISYLISRGAGSKYMVEKGLKVLLFLILPTTFGLAAISRQVLLLFYSDLGQLLDTAFYLMIYGSFSIILTGMMQYFVMLLQASGDFLRILIYTSVGGILKAVLSFFLASVKGISIYSLAIGNISLAGAVCVLSIWRLKKTIGFSLHFFDLFLILFATATMFVLVSNFVKANYFRLSVNILIAILLGALVYLVITMPFILKLLRKNLFKNSAD